MRILYVGVLSNGTTSRDRMDCLEALGHEVIPFDIAPFFDRSLRLNRSIAHRFHAGPTLTKLNEAIMSFSINKLYDIAWIDKGVFIYSEVIRHLKQKSVKKKAIHVTPDAQFLQHRSRHFLSAIPHYNLLVTTKRFEVAHYKASGAENVLLVLQGFGRQFQDVPLLDDRIHQLTFVGNYQRYYRDMISSLADEPFDMRVAGHGWKRSLLTFDTPKKVKFFGPVWAMDYVNFLKSTMIGLGLLSKFIPEQSTTRSFEIPAAGAMLIAERTDEHQSFFTEGLEAEFFSTEDELKDKLKFYFSTPRAIQRIARSGYERCRNSGYSSLDQIKLILSQIDKI